MSWREYVMRVMGDDRQVDVATKTGIDQTTISRWLNQSDDAHTVRLAPTSVAAFARGYQRPVLEAFVVCGWLTPEEAGVSIPITIDLESVSNKDLAAEVRRRLVG